MSALKQCCSSFDGHYNSAGTSCWTLTGRCWGNRAERSAVTAWTAWIVLMWFRAFWPGVLCRASFRWQKWHPAGITVFVIKQDVALKLCYKRNKTHAILLKENNSSHHLADDFPRAVCPGVSYSSYSTNLSFGVFFKWQHFSFYPFIVVHHHH